MTGRTGSLDERKGSNRTGRPLLVGALALGLAAIVVLVVSDDDRLLRLGIVAALWAALMGVFLAAKYRGRPTTATTKWPRCRRCTSSSWSGGFRPSRARTAGRG